MKKEEYPRMTTLYSPIHWKIGNKFSYKMFISNRGRNKKSTRKATMYSLVLENRDSLTVQQEWKETKESYLRDSVHLSAKERVNKLMDLLNPDRNIRPMELYEALDIQYLNLSQDNFFEPKKETTENKVKVDFLITNLTERKFTFFLRSKNFFTIWEYIYPESNNGRIKNEPKSQLKEIKTYTNDKFISIPQKSVKYYPSGKEEQTKFEAIKDNAFFEGDFNVIQQGRNHFVINTSHGSIYHIGDKKIRKVGQIDLEKYKRRIGGNMLFIEDKDEEVVIFFVPVKKIFSKSPCLETKVILDDKEFNRIFKNL